MKILILEDSPERQEKFARALRGHMMAFVDTARDAILFLQDDKFDTVFLDHDLGGQVMVESGDGTGYEVACWLEQHPEHRPKQIIIHSLNPSGAARMKQALPCATVLPAAWDRI